ncbi:MAG: hypothetical protein M3N95_12575 [Actinomycetota bacterium]|nr:hypothetical protein [Actinomycetota bacterium]
MASLFRVLPYLAAARRGQPGHPLYVPRSTGASRVDNPGLYEVLYLGDSAAGAIAEAFGWSPTWNAGLLRGTPSLPGSVRALVEFDLAPAEPICEPGRREPADRVGFAPVPSGDPGPLGHAGLGGFAIRA